MQLEISIRCPVYRQQDHGWGSCEGEIELSEIIEANHPRQYVGQCVACGVRIWFTMKPLIIETHSNPLASMKVDSAIES